MISFDEAAALVRETARALGSEDVALADAHGRRLAEDVTAAIDSPTRAVSVMDGYAVRAADLAALPARLPLQQQIFAGAAAPAPLAAGTCARIFTGAPMPDGADRVVIQEEVARDGEVAVIAGPLSPARFVRQRASDFATGDLLVPAGRVCGPGELMAIAAGDRGSVTCFRRPRVLLIATGDELAAPGNARRAAGAIPDSVSPGIAALVRDWGGEVVGATRLADTLEAMQTAAGEALTRADLIVVTGGASVGEKDFAKRMFEPHGLDLIFSKVAMKPGKPTWLGRCGSRLVIGLPGNPTSAMVTGRLFLAPLVAGLAGGDPGRAWAFEQLTLGGPLAACGDRENFARGRDEGEQLVPLGSQDSGAQATMAAADWLVRQAPASPALDAGDRVEALRFSARP